MLRAALWALCLVACTGDSSDDTDPGTVPDRYAFEGRDGGSSVVHTGQTLRHVLIDDLADYVGGLTAQIDGGRVPQAGEVTADCEFYLAFDASVGGSVEHGVGADLPIVQATYGEIGDANLWGKLAGNDEVGQHEDWSTAFVGFQAGSPQGLVESWLAELDALAVARGNGEVGQTPDGAPIREVYVTADGRDLKQLLEKFLRAGVAFSQGTDDYLDDDLDGKGLLADHTALEEGEPYTALEHQWDEGFGYFGASADFGQRATADIAETPWHDTDGDGSIDLLTEVSFGHSGNAAKRDSGAVSPTTFSDDAFSAFVAGRALLADTDGALDEDQLATLRGHRDEAVAAWEKALAATAVHYVNEVLVDQGHIGTPDYDFHDHAKHWSELKGFALAFQFNPRSPMSDADFAQLHQLIGTAPVLSDASEAERTQRMDDLRAARDILGQTYDFEAANLGGDDGTGGW